MIVIAHPSPIVYLMEHLVYQTKLLVTYFQEQQQNVWAILLPMIRNAIIFLSVWINPVLIKLMLHQWVTALVIKLIVENHRIVKLALSNKIIALGILILEVMIQINIHIVLV